MCLNVVNTALRGPYVRAALVVVLGVLVSFLTVVGSPGPPARADEPVCTISAKLVNSCRPWLGAESGAYGASGFRARMLEHEARIGRPLDIMHEYLGVNSVLSNDILTMARRPATIALVNWRAVNRWADGDGRSATVNAQIDRMANSIKALGTTKIMLAVFHEPENDISPGGGPPCSTSTYGGSSGTTTDYVNMWHNVRARFDALGVANVVWVMNYMGWEGWNCAVEAVWPGNDYVDWLMWDPYPRNATWAYHVGGFYNFLTTHSNADHNFLSKPWGLAEFGNNGASQANVYKMYDDARLSLQNNVYPKIKAYVVWDQHTSSSSDIRVGYTLNGVADPVEQQHYNAFANDPRLTGTAVPEPTDQVPPTVTRTTPEDGATVAGTVDVEGTAGDDVGVAAVELLVDGNVVSSKAPGAGGDVSFAWNSATVGNGSHVLRLRARDLAGNTALSGAASVTVANVDEEAPTPPSGLTGAWSRPSQVTLSWSGSSDNAAVTGYRVYRDGDPIADLGPSARGHVDAGVANHATYTYAVTALDAAGNESDPSVEVVVETGDDIAPSVPSAQAALTADDEATVTWGASTDNTAVAGYRIYRNGLLAGDVTDGSGSLVDGGLDDGITYSYRVAAYDAAGNVSALSAPAPVTTADVTSPTTPLDLAAASTTSTVALTWRAASDNVGVTNYVVYRDGLPLVTLGSTARSYPDSALVGSTLHRYRVTARDAAGNESTLSNEVARTLADTTAPVAPLLTGSLSGFTVRLTWSGASDNVAVTGYTVYRGGVAIATTTSASYTDLTPPLARASSYTVRARDAAGNVSAASNTVSVTVPADRTAPSPPSGFRATAGTTGTRQIVLSWNASTDNVGVTSYYLFRGNAKYRLLGNVTSFTDTGLTAGTRYTYKVYAIDASGNWGGSSGNVSATAR